MFQPALRDMLIAPPQLALVTVRIARFDSLGESDRLRAAALALKRDFNVDETKLKLALRSTRVGSMLLRAKRFFGLAHRMVSCFRTRELRRSNIGRRAKVCPHRSWRVSRPMHATVPTTLRKNRFL
jgi:hypothetical protein